MVPRQLAMLTKYLPPSVIDALAMLTPFPGAQHQLFAIPTKSTFWYGTAAFFPLPMHTLHPPIIVL